MMQETRTNTYTHILLIEILCVLQTFHRHIWWGIKECVCFYVACLKVNVRQPGYIKEFNDFCLAIIWTEYKD